MDPHLTPNQPTRHRVIDNVRYVVGSVRRYDRPLIWIALLHALFSAVGRFVPVVLPKYVIDQITAGSAPEVMMGAVVGLAVALFVANSVSQTTRNTLNNRFIVVRLRLIAESGFKFMTTDYQNLEDPAVLDLSKRGDRAYGNNADGVEGVMHRLLSLAGHGIVLLGTAAVIATLHPLLLLAIVALLLTDFAMSSRARRLDKAVRDGLAPVERKIEYVGRTMSDFAFGKEIRLFGMKEFLLDRYRALQRESAEGHTRIQKVWLVTRNVLAVTSMIQEGLMYAWLCWRVVGGGLAIGDFVMYAAAIRAFAQAVGGALDDVSHIRQQNEVINDFRGFLDYPERPSGTERLPADPAHGRWGLEFVNVSFRYPGSNRDALQGVSLRVKPGERLAVVGLNGAGKSTFIKLMTRLYEPDEGQILLNGVDARTYDKREYQRLFSVVFQDIALFAFTVAENVSMRAYADTDVERAWECLEQAGLGDKIRSLPKGIATPVLKVIDEAGVEFSGGENQKFALARALYKGAPIVILDEPTAALDALAEARLYEQFDALIGDRTAIYISHRLASTRFCDRVVVFESGRIIETGTHDELMKQGGRYAELFALQAHYYQKKVQPA